MQPSKPVGGRYYTIAHDLEDLPLELIEEVIKELDFERTIRLSDRAGPQLFKALSISPTWRPLFDLETDRTTWQRCLRLTDTMNTLCYRSGREARPFFKRRDQRRDRGWNAIDLSFLGSGGVGAHTPRNFLDPTPHPFLDVTSLRTLWLKVLSKKMSEASYFLPGAVIHNIEAYMASEQDRMRYNWFNHNLGSDLTLTVGELEEITGLYQRALKIRTNTQADELRRLATLYDAHSKLLKEPFAPQSPRSNLLHIPQQLRSRARILENTIPSWYNRTGGRSYFRNEFPALVPYDWTLRLFVLLIKQDKVTVDTRCQKILGGMPRYYRPEFDSGDRISAPRTLGTPWSPPTDLPSQSHKLSVTLCQPNDINRSTTRFWTGPPELRYLHRAVSDATTYTAHAKVELAWLETFVDVVAGLIERFPQAAEAAQAEGCLGRVEPDVLAEKFAGKMEL